MAKRVAWGLSDSQPGFTCWKFFQLVKMASKPKENPKWGGQKGLNRPSQMLTAMRYVAASTKPKKTDKHQDTELDKMLRQLKDENPAAFMDRLLKAEADLKKASYDYKLALLDRDKSVEEKDSSMTTEKVDELISALLASFEHKHGSVHG